MAYHVFISYRRDGGDAMARLLYDRLKAEGYEPFLDIEQMRSGRFNRQLYDRIGECEDFLLILSPGALDRCRNEDDWVRLEIQEALRLKKNIVPFMLRGFTFPRADSPLTRLMPFYRPMPASILEIADFQGVTASQEYFDSTFSRLLSLLTFQPTQASTLPAAPPEEPKAVPVAPAPRRFHNLPVQVSLFELLGIREMGEFDIGQHWAASRAERSLAVPIGVGEDGSILQLDLHRIKDGPHGLIGGPEGTGKSEFLYTLMLSLALHYPPDMVQMLLVDIDGLHLTRDLHRLPHLCPFMGDTLREGVGGYLEAVCTQIDQKLQQTRTLLAAHGVRNLDQYNELARQDPSLSPCPHLVVMIDGYAQLKREWPEFTCCLAELGLDPEVSRCGLHLIFSTRKPEGVVDDKLDELTSFKICTSGLSQWREGEIIPETPAARPGRLYLQKPASGSIQHLQLAYSGQGAADVADDAQGYQWFFGKQTQREMIIQAIVRKASE